MTAKRTLSFDFKDMSKKGGNLVIEGYANRATVDRMKERIDPKGWLLDNYKKNPIVLFDHGHDPSFGFMPIGKAVAVEAREDGLYTKIQLSKSQNEKIAAIRDLVEEGILKTFSVGFNPLDMKKAVDDPEVVDITKAELVECSIVPIPMNQDSMFSLVGKRLGGKAHALAKRWFEGHQIRIKLREKKAWAALAIHQRISDLISAEKVKSFDEVVMQVATEMSLKPTQVSSIFSGEIEKLDDMTLKTFAGILAVEYDLLKQINEGAVEAIDDMRSPEAVQEKAAMKQGVVVQAVEVPKEAYDNAELALEAVAAAGYSTEKMTENDSMYVFEQADPKGCDMEKAAMVDLGSGIMAKVCPMKPEGKDEGEKAGEAENVEDEMTEEKPEDEGKDDSQELKDKWKAAVDAMLASWKQDEAKWAEAVAASQAALGKEDLAFLMWWYGGMGGGEKSAHPAQSTKGVTEIDDNPYLQEARQTNVLLGTLVNEIKQLSASLKGTAVDADKPKDDIKEGEKPTDEEMKSALALVKEYKSLIKEKLDGLGVVG